MTDLDSVSSASYVIADHYIFAIFGVVALHERPGSLRDLCSLSLRHFVFYIYKFLAANCEDWDEFTSPRENRPNKMAKEMHLSRLEISRSFIYTYSHSKEKNGNVECQ